jgi:hypothetical protein
MNLNRNYLLVGGVGAIVVVVVVVMLSSFASMSLDVILANKDCEALEKWGDEHWYDENLNLTDEQKKKIFSVGLECGMKAVNNMFGSSDSSSTLSEEQREMLRVFDEIIESRNCDGMKEWTYTHGVIPDILTYEQKMSKIKFDGSCDRKWEK